MAKQNTSVGLPEHMCLQLACSVSEFMPPSSVHSCYIFLIGPWSLGSEELAQVYPTSERVELGPWLSLLSYPPGLPWHNSFPLRCIQIYLTFLFLIIGIFSVVGNSTLLLLLVYFSGITIISTHDFGLIHLYFSLGLRSLGKLYVQQVQSMRQTKSLMLYSTVHNS